MILTEHLLCLVLRIYIGKNKLNKILPPRAYIVAWGADIEHSEQVNLCVCVCLYVCMYVCVMIPLLQPPEW